MKKIIEWKNNIGSVYGVAIYYLKIRKPEKYWDEPTYERGDPKPPGHYRVSNGQIYLYGLENILFTITNININRRFEYKEFDGFREVTFNKAIEELKTYAENHLQDTLEIVFEYQNMIDKLGPLFKQEEQP